MYTVLIDTSERYKKSVKLVGDGKVVGEKSGDIDVAVSIKELLVENNISITDVEEFVSNPGPGSFTGLKIGVTIANVLNKFLGKKDMDDLVYPDYGGEPNIHKTKWIKDRS